MRLSTALLALSALCAALPSSAQDEPPPRKVAITLSPLHLLNPELHVTGEVRLAPRLSTAASLGAGRITEERQTYRIWEVGGQLRVYLLGAFSQGLMLGADLGYVDVNGQPEGAMEMLLGTRAGAFLGYKKTLKAGFTVEAQLGPVRVWGNADDAEWQTLSRLNVGWSF